MSRNDHFCHIIGDVCMHNCFACDDGFNYPDDEDVLDEFLYDDDNVHDDF